MYEKVLLHPTYIPSIVSAAAMAQSKTLVFEVNDNFNKQSLRNRAYINTPNGSLSITIPVKHNHGKGHKKTADALIENDFEWQRQHWKSIQMAYRSSPFFEFYEDDFKVFYEGKFTNLLAYNLEYNRLLLDLIKISAPIKETSSYEKKTEIVDLRTLVDAKKDYTLKLPHYIQVFGEKQNIDPKIAVIDLLFSEGPNTLGYLRSVDLSTLAA